tara:strand:+ start:319 stop:531 length:213 start_codon:yes stop_codon:yes gene_type:complete
MSTRAERKDRELAASQDRKAASKAAKGTKTQMQHNIKNLDAADSWTLKEKVLLYPHLDWTEKQREAAGLI